MPSAVTLPTFYEREKLLYQKLNAAMSAINAKFLAGVGAAEISWPLTADGNLNMSIHNITGGRQIWGFVNADEYDTLDDAITAAGSGGVVLVPPETTIPSSGSSVAGIGVTVIGSGPSSVIQLTSGATGGYALRFNSATRGMLANLTLDGNSATGSGQEGVRIADCTGMIIANVFFRNFSGPALKIQGGTSQVSVMGCHFNGGSAEHIYATQCDQLAIVACTSDSSTGIPIRLACTDGSATLTVAIGDTQIDNAGSTGVSFLGFNSIGTTSPARLWMSNVGITDTGGTTKDGIIAGSSTAVLESCQIVGCTIRSTTAGGITVNANHGAIVGNNIDNPTTFGIDLDTSRYLNVTDNYIFDATIGVDASAGQNCRVSGNILRSCTTAISFGGTDHTISDNPGAAYGYPYGDVAIYYDGTTPSSSGTTVTTFSIPAGVLKQGSYVRIYLSGEADNSGSYEDVQLKVNGQVFARCQRTTSTSNDYWLIGELYISSFTDQDAIGRGYGGQESSSFSTARNVSLAALTGVDCSTAVDITVGNTGGTVKVQMASICYGHATLVSSPWT